jgi:hypothetical protein
MQVTPVPRMMFLVRASALAMNISGALMFSH